MSITGLAVAVVLVATTATVATVEHQSSGLMTDSGHRVELRALLDRLARMTELQAGAGRAIT